MSVTTDWGIYYPPTTMTTAANVPLDMKTAAESVEAALNEATTPTIGALSLDTSLYVGYSGYRAPSYRLSADGQVMLGGGIGIKTGLSGDQIIFSPNTQYTIGQLPVGLHPTGKLIFDPIVSFSMRTQAFWTIYVNTDGTIKLEHSSSTAVTVSRANFLLGLDNMNYWV